MIVRPLIPQQSTVNGKRKVISRYEEGGEAKGIGGFFQKLLSDPTLIETAQAEQITPQTANKIAEQSKAFVERSPVYLAGAAGDVLDLGMMGLSKLPSTGSFLQKDVKVDGYIYIKADPKVSHERIRKRNRQGEENIPIEYLEKLHKAHNEWLIQENTTNIDGNAEMSDDYIHNIYCRIEYLIRSIKGIVYRNK